MGITLLIVGAFAAVIVEALLAGLMKWAFRLSRRTADYLAWAILIIGGFIWVVVRI